VLKKGFFGDDYRLAGHHFGVLSEYPDSLSNTVPGH
jgi:hypothetical protein